ncbi:hypothetical protein DSM106972_039540 [Dulcicalothrix desertica PCC 7102]|uniref:MobA/VirD2-like nuclease domain-containing protein n=1 Tax=Dulcicalothrix desertica PCC 7102 TaxID=232991 RepID=A0A433VGB0_9CYAN|nr:hypothetical protein [Dulcicalothrix desertica]RUT05133.1 hypothetical protein DSM106972_039540 [Dulcicalothrix desertica PCC 7102]TWH43360.1 hypothetical protein CAL7102_07074 [Dulcicalothrix desertica PCC 7102]
MINKIFKYSSCDVVVKYVLDDLGATLDHTNMTSRTSDMLAKEFELFEEIKPEERCTCYHIIFSIDSRDPEHHLGECNQHLSEYDYYQLARRYLEQMGFLSGDGMHKSQYVMARTQSVDEQDIHIVVSRVRMNGTVVSNYLEEQRNEFVVNRLNHEFDMQDLTHTC